jgi:hypothetical protein
LLLRFQSVRGALFEDLGLLVTAFMAGLAAGSASVQRLAPYPRPRMGRALLIALAVLALLLAASLRLGVGGGLFTALPALAATGALVGGLLAETSAPGAAPESTITLYAADLAGACLGSVACLLLVPVLGLAAVAAATGATCLAAVLLTG